jgi:HEAT repeat protein
MWLFNPGRACRCAVALILVLLAQSATSDPHVALPPKGLVTPTLRDRAWKMLQEGAESKEYKQRAQAVQAMGTMRQEPRAVKLMEAALEDKIPAVRVAAANGLGEMRSKSSIPDLQKALGDRDLTVGLAAAAALVAMKNDEGYAAYYEVLTGRRKTGESLPQEAMSTLRDHNKLITLVVEQGITFAPFGGYGVAAWNALHMNNPAPVRASAAIVLVNDPDPESLQALEAASEDKEWIVRATALKAMGLRNDPSLASKMVPMLDDKSDAVRFSAAASILRLTFTPPTSTTK